MTASVSSASASGTREQKPQLRELAPRVYGYISDFDPHCGFIVGDEPRPSRSSLRVVAAPRERLGAARPRTRYQPSPRCNGRYTAMPASIVPSTPRRQKK